MMYSLLSTRLGMRPVKSKSQYLVLTLIYFVALLIWIDFFYYPDLDQTIFHGTDWRLVPAEI